MNTDPLVQDWQGYLQKFIDAGGVGLVNSWADEGYNLKGIEIAKASLTDFPSCIVKATVGWHPLECVENVVTDQNVSEKMQRLKKLYSDNKEYIVAIGETWLDLHYPNGLETLETQQQLFIEHCNFARETGLPIVVHSRDAFKETFEILKDYVDLTIYFHCWGYSPQELRQLLVTSNELDWKLFIGFCGNVTYKKAEELRETLRMLPLDQLLLETDAPYLSPQLIRGETNHPANVKYIYEYVSDFLWMSLEKLSEQVYKNFCRVYKL